MESENFDSDEDVFTVLGGERSFRGRLGSEFGLARAATSSVPESQDILEEKALSYVFLLSSPSPPSWMESIRSSSSATLNDKRIVDTIKYIVQKMYLIICLIGSIPYHHGPCRGSL